MIGRRLRPAENMAKPSCRSCRFPLAINTQRERLKRVAGSTAARLFSCSVLGRRTGCAAAGQRINAILGLVEPTVMISRVWAACPTVNIKTGIRSVGTRAGKIDDVAASRIDAGRAASARAGPCFDECENRRAVSSLRPRLGSARSNLYTRSAFASRSLTS
jgi:hypothetical protein